MKTVLKWKKGFFSNEYTLYSNGQSVGRLHEKAFTQNAFAELYHYSFLFKTKGFFKQQTEIIDLKKSLTVGEIVYNSWMTKATITIGSSTFFWKYDNSWNSKWHITNNEGDTVRYSSTTSGGFLESTGDDALLILCGLFVTNYYKQATVAIMVAVLLPIWINATR